MNTGGRIRRFQIDEQSWVEESSAPWIWLRTTGRTHNWDSKMSEFQEGPNDFFKHIVWSLRNGWNISIPQRYCRLVPENCSKAISTTKWILLIFWFSSANKSYDYTYPAVYEVKIALYQRNNEHTLIEKYFIANKCCHLNLQQIGVVTSKITDRLSHNKCSNSENVWNIARIIKVW